MGYAQPPQLFLNDGKGSFVDVAAEIGGGFSQPKVGRGLAYGDFDRDGDLDLLITTNNGPAYLYRNDLTSPAEAKTSPEESQYPISAGRNQVEPRCHRSVLKISHGGSSQSRLVKGGSSYLSQSELPVTFGLGRRDRIDRLVIQWPSGRTEEYKNLAAGRML